MNNWFMIVLYFSGTGNTRYVAEMFAKRMDCQSISIESKCDFAALIQNNEEIVFCFPIYGSTPPGIMRTFVKKYKDALQGKKLVLLCTQALGSGDGARSLMDELESVSCEVIYAEHFFMPNNICNIPFPVLPEKAYRRMTKKKVQKIYDNLKRKKYKKEVFIQFRLWWEICSVFRLRK